mgnify:FL=1
MLECAAATTGDEASLTCPNPGQAVSKFATSADQNGITRRKRDATLFSETCIPPNAEVFNGYAYFQFEAVIPEVSKYQ